MVGPTCSRCGGGLRLVRRGDVTFVACPSARTCRMRRLRADGTGGGPGATWAAVLAENGRMTLLAVGGEAAVWDEALKCRRANQSLFVCPLTEAADRRVARGRLHD